MKKILITLGILIIFIPALTFAGVQIKGGKKIRINRNKTTIIATSTPLAISGLVAYFPFDGMFSQVTKTSDTATSTDTVNGNAASSTNRVPLTFRRVTLEPGKIGQGVCSAGAITDMRASTTAPMRTATNITVATWVYPKETPVTDSIASIARNGPAWSNPFASFNLRLNSNTQVEFGVSVGNTYTGALFTVPTLIPREWVHLTGVWDGATTTLYYNGVNVGQASAATNAFVTGNITYSTANTARPLMFLADLSSSPNSSRFNGCIDDFRMYNRALSVNEVFNIYNLGK